LAPKLEIAGKRKFGAVSNLITLDVIYNQFVKGLVGITAVMSISTLDFSQQIKLDSCHDFYLHLDRGKIK
jgi:hypothetical protein